jgi:hypothetical protein
LSQVEELEAGIMSERAEKVKAEGALQDVQKKVEELEAKLAQAGEHWWAMVTVTVLVMMGK